MYFSYVGVWQLPSQCSCGANFESSSRQSAHNPGTAPSVQRPYQKVLLSIRLSPLPSPLPPSSPCQHTFFNIYIYIYMKLGKSMVRSVLNHFKISHVTLKIPENMRKMYDGGRPYLIPSLLRIFYVHFSNSAVV